MRANHNLAIAFPPPEDEQTADAPQFEQGVADALGDRVTLFDEATKQSFEMLRFKPEFGDAPGFERALRASVEAIGRLDGSSAMAREVTRFDKDGVLVLVSTHTEGRRLADLMPRARGTALAIELVQAIGPALATLHQNGQVHGALTPERIVVSTEGQPTLIEEVLGAAIASLALPADRLRSEFGIAVPNGHDVGTLDSRIDVIQLGFIVLSLLLGQRLAPVDYPRLTTEWLDEFSRTSPETAIGFRPWLERTLQIGDRPFATAVGALSAFDDVLNTLSPGPQSATRPAARLDAAGPATGIEPDAPKAAARPAMWRWATAVLALIVLALAGGVGYLYVENLSVSATSLVIARPERPAPTPLMPAPLAAAVALAEPAGAAPTAEPAGTLPVAAASDAPQFGGVTLRSPMELQVFQNGKLLGSTSSPIAIAAGTHVLDVVNEEFDFRARQTVVVEAGQMASVRVALPRGRVNINAAPWAEVQIDGAAAGQTPLANVSLTIGEHEVIFSHPEFGEQRQTVVVTADGITRVTAVFKQ